MNKPDDVSNLHVHSRPTVTAKLSIPTDTFTSIQKVAAARDMDPDAVMKLYIGQGLRQDTSKLFSDRILDATAEVLERHVEYRPLPDANISIWKPRPDLRVPPSAATTSRNVRTCTSQRYATRCNNAAETSQVGRRVQLSISDTPDTSPIRISVPAGADACKPTSTSRTIRAGSRYPLFNRFYERGMIGKAHVGAGALTLARLCFYPHSWWAVSGPVHVVVRPRLGAAILESAYDSLAIERSRPDGASAVSILRLRSRPVRFAFSSFYTAIVMSSGAGSLAFRKDS